VDVDRIEGTHPRGGRGRKNARLKWEDKSKTKALLRAGPSVKKKQKSQREGRGPQTFHVG